MNAITMREMIEATRLVGAGRLAEATQLLRGAGPATPASAPEEAAASRSPDEVVDPDPAPEGATSGMPPGPDGTPAARAKAWIRDPVPALAATLRDMAKSGALAKGRQPAGEPLPVGASFEEHAFANAAGQRSYKLFVPSRYDGSPLPLVVMLHGCTQDPDDFAVGTGMNALAERETFLVAYPAQSSSANAQKCWNWFSLVDQRRDGGEPSLIAGITRQIARDRAVDPRRIFVAGLSAGGAAAAIMGAAYPDLFAAVGIHSGLACGAARDMSSALAAMRHGARPSAPGGATAGPFVPTIVFHGDHDHTVNPLNGDQALAQSRRSAGTLTIETSHGRVPGGMAFTRTAEHDGDGRPLLERWIVHGGKHAWSGGSPDGSYTEPRGPDASREMLRFFLANAGPAAERA